MHGLRQEVAAEARRLLRFLFVRLSAVPANPAISNSDMLQLTDEQFESTNMLAKVTS